MPLSQIVSASIQDGAVAPVDLSSDAQYYGFKNRIINGAMGISQRGTSFSTPASGSYTLDRWQIQWAGAAPASVAQVAGPTGFRNALQITGAASNTSSYILQRIESYNCSDLSGATITIQANIAGSSAQTVLWQLYYPTVQDNYTGVTFITGGNWAATTTATTFTATITGLPSGVTNGLQLIIGPNNAGAFTSGTITITGVQLEKSSTATSFDYRPYTTELQLCQRYLPAVNGAGSVGAAFCASATLAFASVNHPVTPRVAPTGLTTSAANTFTIYGNSAVSVTPTAISYNVGGTLASFISISTASGLTNGSGTALYANGSASQILFTGCEL